MTKTTNTAMPAEPAAGQEAWPAFASIENHALMQKSLICILNLLPTPPLP